MSFYGNMANAAARLLKSKGQQVTITRETGGGTDPVTGEAIPAVRTNYYPYGVLTKIADHLIDGTRVKAGDRELVLDNTVEPDTSDVVTVAGEDWSVAEVYPMSPAGTPVVHRVRVRR